MRKGGGKKKGSGFERHVSKLLTEWASGQHEEYWFWRTPSSGAIATITGSNAKLSGDIIPLKEEALFMAPFSIECKCGYPGASFDKHLAGTGDAIHGFWKQCTTDARKNDKRPILIFKKNRTPSWIGISAETYEELREVLKHLEFIHMRYEDLEEMYAFDMKRFFEVVTAEHVKEACNTLSS